MAKIYFKVIEVSKAYSLESVYLGHKGNEPVFALPLLAKSGKLFIDNIEAVSEGIKTKISIWSLTEEWKKITFDFLEKDWPELVDKIPGYFIHCDFSLGYQKGERPKVPAKINNVLHNTEDWWDGYKDLSDIPVAEEWKPIFQNIYKYPYWKKLDSFLKVQWKWCAANKKLILPGIHSIFKIFNDLKPGDVKVVILGQDPYPNKNNAVGYAFGTSSRVEIPKSLANIFEEINSDPDIYFVKPLHGDLSGWVSQGVMLLNMSLTVLEGCPNTHQKAWSLFTPHIIGWLSSNFDNIVFMLWGNNAKVCKQVISHKKHKILEASHPSPYSAKNGFFGCRHFSKANQYLKENGKIPIDWNYL